jgi:membrane protein implicated in regulation of membrane protease activity
MLLYLHGEENVWVLGLFFLLAVAFLLTIFIFAMVIIYRFIKNSKNEIQELNLNEKEDKNS